MFPFWVEMSHAALLQMAAAIAVCVTCVLQLLAGPRS